MNRGGAAPARQLPLFDRAGAAEERFAAPDEAAHGDPKPTAAAEQPLVFRHPQATHEVQLAGRTVAYVLRRARRRSIGFVVAPDGLTVSAPRWVRLADIETALLGKAAWILRKLAEQRERGSRQQAARVEWRDGCTLPYLGGSLRIALDGSAGAAPRLVDEEGAAPGGIASLHLPRDTGTELVRDGVRGWLQQQARRVFEARCAHFAPLMGVHPRRLSLTSAATRWGSASANGAIRLNWRLIHFPLATVDYVVVHELAHLVEMNHSPAFWYIVRTALPDFESARGILRTQVLPALD